MVGLFIKGTLIELRDFHNKEYGFTNYTAVINCPLTKFVQISEETFNVLKSEINNEVEIPIFIRAKDSKVYLKESSK